MGRFERRLQERLKDPERRAGYFAARAEIELTDILDECRQEAGISQTELGERLGISQSAVSQFLGAEDGITIQRLVEYLVALRLEASIEIRESAEAESSPIHVDRISKFDWAPMISNTVKYVFAKDSQEGPSVANWSNSFWEAAGDSDKHTVPDEPAAA